MMTQPADSQLAFMERLTETLCRHNLRQPARIFLQAGRPLALLIAQFIWIAQPVLGLLYPRQAINQFAHLLEEPELLNQFLISLETEAD
ncbi:MAG: hypothetical protein KC418_13260 [Anaerolineales bacterium]|nr:hypothetical protein [Anaerolineales bacterium]MCB8954020.1 hypothetical protein [Ardenticatenales bacterium]